jgi:16S rRNA (guanine966-N2)-methyltransferase
VRVIAGELGGRRLVVPRGLATRPTSDRVREALFMALEPLTGLRVIDLFAGSGALGIEALSRGAAWCDFVESERAALASLGTNLEALGLNDRAHVWRARLPGALGRMEAPLAAADLVLTDPPYGGEIARETLHALARQRRLREGTRVVVEHHAKDDLPEYCGPLVRERERRYGETTISSYRVTAPDAGDRREP